MGVPLPSAPPPPPPPPPPYYIGPPPGWVPAQRPHDDSHVVVLVVVVVVVLLIVAAVATILFFFVAFSGVTSAARVSVTSASWEVEYRGVASGYFGGSQVTSCSGCPITVWSGGEFTFRLTLTNSDPAASHSVTTLVVALPFELVGTNPSLPIVVPAGGTETILLTIDAATSGGSYTLSGTIGTT